MANQPTQSQEPNWPPDVGLGKGRATTPSPPWLWLVVICLLALIFWHFVPRAEVQVLYAPWFLQQVEANNIESLSIQGIEVRGTLRQIQPYQGPASKAVVLVRKFYTYFPSEASIEPVVQKLTSPREGSLPPVQIEGHSANPGGLAWIVFLLPTFVILGMIYLMMRRARDRDDRSPRGQSP